MGNFSSGLIAIVALCVATTAQAACAPDSVELRGHGGVQRFGVEVADTEAERALGLMNRTDMPMSAGMLFVYPAPQRAVFWMKNTLIPLDMIFADSTGLVTGVHSNAIPQDETPIDGGNDVLYVLEINAGLAKRMGIVAGTQMRAEVIEKSSAIWPCSGD